MAFCKSRHAEGPPRSLRGERVEIMSKIIMINENEITCLKDAFSILESITDILRDDRKNFRVTVYNSREFLRDIDFIEMTDTFAEFIDLFQDEPKVNIKLIEE